MPPSSTATTWTPTKSSPSSSSSGSPGRATTTRSSSIGASCPTDGSPNPAFELNHPSYEGASILIAGRNFGCGSSREHAPWALNDYGFRVIIAPSFADIFRNNCFQNSLLTITLDEAAVRGLMEKAAPGNDYRPTIDLDTQTISDPSGASIPFEIDDFRRHSLLNGLDDIGLTLQHEDKIAAYERARGIG